MKGDLNQVLASALREHLQSRLDAPCGVFDHLCTQESYKNDAVLLQSLDSYPKYMDESNALSIKYLRQAFKWVYKVRAESSDVQNEEAIIGFEQRSAVARSWRLPFCDSESWPESKLARVYVLAQQLIQSACRGYSIGSPSHGPGTTFFRYRTLLAKYAWLERDVPVRLWRRHREFYKPSGSSDVIEPLLIERHDCRITTVPKDVRGPRLVAPHLASAIWVQQAILEGIERTVLTHPLFLGSWPGSECDVKTVQLRDQSVNQRVAKYASENPKMYATLDLKDASDYVSWRLVCFLFKGTTLLRDLYAVRATHCVLPDGRAIPLGMHAPMGSAVCFPIMALSLWSLCTATKWVLDNEHQRYRPNSKSLWVGNKPFVFGDDIIIPTDLYSAVRTVLTSAGLRLNANKCFAGDGGFRESCGCDFYRGYNVTPLMLRRSDIETLEGSTSMISLFNRLRADGQDAVAEVLFDRLLRSNRRMRNGASRVVFSSDHRQLAIHTDSVWEALRLNRAVGNITRWNPYLQRCEVLASTSFSEETGCENQGLDSRARLYESLAAKKRRDASPTVTGGERDSNISFGWLLNKPRAGSTWVAV